MEFNSTIPIYLQVITMIKREIVLGVLSPGEKLPSVRDLALHYTINPNTASRVYKELESESVCFTRRGMGTFVTEDAARIQQLKREMARTLVNEFMEGIRLLGITEEEAILMIKNKKEL